MNSSQNTIEIFDSIRKIKHTINEDSVKFEYETLSSEKYFYVKDSSQYSKQFLAFWKGRFTSVEIIEDSIIVDNLKDDFVIIPTTLPLHKKIEYIASEDKTKYRLTVKRINNTEVEYEFWEEANDHVKFHKKSVADLEGAFYLGWECSFEYEGELFPMNDYNDYTDSTFTTLTIGAGSIEEAIFLFGFEDKRIDFLKINMQRKK